MNEKLKYGQIVLIKNKRYTVVGMIEFKEDTWIWQEYKLVMQESKKVNWLNVEQDDNGILQYSLYEENYSINTNNSISFNYNNDEYSLYEQGSAMVNDYFGRVDVDIGEYETYKEYINTNKTSLISVEVWDGDIEKSFGEYIQHNDIVITEEIEQVQSLQAPKASKGFIFTILSFFVVIPIFAIFTSINVSRNAMSDYIEKNPLYSYVTSVTNNENNKKAKVYKTNLTIDETVRNIIDGIPEKVKKVTQTDNDDNEGIGIFTNFEYAYVYESEDNETYVQVSKNNFVTSNTNSYHSRYRTRGYYRTYTTNSTHSEYTSYLNSARQQSINSRTSSGGGTSSGK